MGLTESKEFPTLPPMNACNSIEQLQQQLEREQHDRLELEAELHRTRQTLERYQRIEDELSAAKEQLRAVIDAIPGLVSWIGSNLHYIGVNQHLANTFGRSQAEFVGQKVGFLSSSSQFDDFIREFFQTNALSDQREITATVNGEPQTYLIVAQKYNRGETAVSVGVNVTELKQAEVRVRQALQKEKEINDLKSHLITTVSHEFRTPMTAILGAASLLENYSKKWTEEKKQNYLQRIQANIQHMNKMLGTILEIGQTEDGKVRVHRRPVDLELLCQQVVKDLQRQAPSFAANASQSRPTVELIEIGSTERPTRGNFDESLLYQLLMHPLSNALKYSPEGGAIALELNCDRPNSTVRFRIIDRGMGIPKSDRSRVFDSFYRGQNIGNIPGMGMGLTIAKRYVKAHEGAIAIESEVGIGTTVTITLPLVEMENNAETVTRDWTIG